MRPKPMLLAILDGWGYSESTNHNAIASACTPNWDQWWSTYPHTLIACSGTAVGLPEGQMGNSEVGHMHMGAGRIVKQDLSRINDAIRHNKFSQNVTLVSAFNQAKENQSTLHVLGLLSSGGVHSHADHFYALIDAAADNGIQNLCIHAFLDGRDTPPRSAKNELEQCETHLQKLEKGRIASIIGRYYAMDRDTRWDRIEEAYNLLTRDDVENTASSALSALEMAYARDEIDEFVKATRIQSQHDNVIRNGDILIFMNFRADRARQLSYALTQTEFSAFERQVQPKISQYLTLTQYDKSLPAKVLFPPIDIKHSCGEILANHGLTQYRIAETEKYAHVTFFFNGGREFEFEGESRELIPSPAVKTYDLQPEMSAQLITDALIKIIHQQQHDVIICNFANADMVGHTGNFAATVQAIECLDQCLGKLYEALQTVDGEMLITADHGNAEKLYDENTEQAHTAHTNALVPLLYLGKPAEAMSDTGSLIDIAPTLLHLIGITPPAEMTGHPLFKLKT